MAGIGDVNGDGLSDVAVGAPFSSWDGRIDNGSVYVVYGRRTAGTVDLRTLGHGRRERRVRDPGRRRRHLLDRPPVRRRARDLAGRGGRPERRRHPGPPGRRPRRLGRRAAVHGLGLRRPRAAHPVGRRPGPDHERRQRHRGARRRRRPAETAPASPWPLSDAPGTASSSPWAPRGRTWTPAPSMASPGATPRGSDSAISSAAVLTPSASYSLTMRVHLPRTPGAFAQVARGDRRCRGAPGRDRPRPRRPRRHRRDVTVNASDDAHGRRIVEAVRAVDGVRVESVSDRTFLMHLGGKIEVQPQGPDQDARRPLDGLHARCGPRVRWPSTTIPARPSR